VVLKGDAPRLIVHGPGFPKLCHFWQVPHVHSRPQALSHLPQQACAVCLEDFRLQEELGVLPCQHAFHRKCLLKWLEVRCVCPMCNKPAAEPRAGIGTLLDELV
ncbi:RING finger protein 122-like, partial [Cyanistes caeruleus]|uniref:RING finger protein 122-like n=1 Tax=Cyanistes caeruleus TaxID=156563 RepID=UPI000CDA6D89